jgi:ADP-ribose pyrophosphatase YjhB (NUDIX family)
MYKENLMDLLNEYIPEDNLEKEYKNHIIDFVLKNSDIFGKDNKLGHITGSSCIVSKDGEKVLLTHHNKLNRWLQPGGHTEIDELIADASHSEAFEETGLRSLKLFNNKIFDIDVHVIPQNQKEQEHFHYDIRFMFLADNEEDLCISTESKDLRWFKLDEAYQNADNHSIKRMILKTLELKEKIL